MSSKELLNSMPRVIAFLGTVGAGKSTHLELLYLKFNKNMFRVKKAPALKTNHFFARTLTLFLVKLLTKKRKDVYPIKALIDEKPVVFRKLFKLWLFLDIFSIFIQFLVTIYFPLKRGYIVLVEEYIPAAIADYTYMGRALNVPFETFSFAVNFLIKLMQLAQAQVIFLNADTRTLNIRWKHRGSLDEKSDYLHMQRTTLLSLSKKLTFHELIYIDTTNQNIKETHELIISRLNKFNV